MLQTELWCFVIRDFIYKYRSRYILAYENIYIHSIIYIYIYIYFCLWIEPMKNWWIKLHRGHSYFLITASRCKNTCFEGIHTSSLIWVNFFMQIHLMTKKNFRKIIKIIKYIYINNQTICTFEKRDVRVIQFNGVLVFYCVTHLWARKKGHSPSNDILIFSIHSIYTLIISSSIQIRHSKESHHS